MQAMACWLKGLRYRLSKDVKYTTPQLPKCIGFHIFYVSRRPQSNLLIIMYNLVFINANSHCLTEYMCSHMSTLSKAYNEILGKYTISNLLPFLYPLVMLVCKIGALFTKYILQLTIICHFNLLLEDLEKLFCFLNDLFY